MAVISVCNWPYLSIAKTIELVSVRHHLYQTQLASGEVDDYGVDVVKALCQITGDTPEVNFYPWARTYKVALTKANVAIVPLIRNEARELHFHWIGKTDSHYMYAWGLKSKFSQKLNSSQELKDYLIATERSSYLDQYFIALGFDKIVCSVNSEQNIALLFKNRIDLIIGSELEVDTLTRVKKLDKSKLRKVLIIDDLKMDIYIAFSKKTHMSVVNRYRKAFTQLESSGKLGNIQRKWFMNKYSAID